MPNRMEQVGLAESHSTIEKERIICVTRRFSDGQRCRMGKLVGAPHNERREGIAGIQARWWNKHALSSRSGGIELRWGTGSSATLRLAVWNGCRGRRCCELSFWRLAGTSCLHRINGGSAVGPALVTRTPAGDDVGIAVAGRVSLAAATTAASTVAVESRANALAPSRGGRRRQALSWRGGVRIARGFWQRFVR